MDAVAARLRKLDWVRDVHRMFLNDSPDFGGMGSNSLPAILLDERLPLPISVANHGQNIQSRLPIPVWVCLPLRGSDKAKDFRSALADVIAALLEDTTWGGWAKTTTIDPESQAPPVESELHVEFGIICNVIYLHSPAET